MNLLVALLDVAIVFHPAEDDSNALVHQSAFIAGNRDVLGGTIDMGLQSSLVNGL
ncbi:hypothetical protein GCM10023213_28590 [Prosthecobacter algae]|uniref:Uncharacterized protein n=1 Tax=Prosthecobacter algae TaxID=1144682 RepID=A0ABP9PBT0_9BACT